MSARLCQINGGYKVLIFVGAAVILLLAFLFSPFVTFAQDDSPLFFVRHETQVEYIVINPADSGPGTLRQSLEDADNGDSITFDSTVFPLLNPTVIALSSILPDISQGNLTIDASNAGVILDGSGITDSNADGMTVRSSNNIIRGLQIRHFLRIGINLTTEADSNTIGGDSTIGTGPSGQGNIIVENGDSGIYIGGGLNNIIIGNYIGTNVTSTVAQPNNNGVLLREGASSNRIGGTTAGTRNIISGNKTTGVQIMDANSTNNTVIGNYIGVNKDGTVANGNNYGGIWILTGAHDNRIGGITAGESNLISGNLGDGVRLVDVNTINNTIVGNFIGTNPIGTAALPNEQGGINIYNGASFNHIGGSTPGERNIISGNGGDGIGIAGNGTTNNSISGNFIGISVNGMNLIPNQSEGVCISGGASLNRIGGSTPGERNIISANHWFGILITSAMNNTISGNYIGTNVSGNSAMPNVYDGIRIDGGSQNNVVGGTTEGERNVVSGNNDGGVAIYDPGTSFNRVIGNYVGLDASGTAALPNATWGVKAVLGASYNIVGGTTVGERNIISGNGAAGVEICADNPIGNTVFGNYIGTDFTGTIAIPNSSVGVELCGGASNTIIGGDTSTERNLISGNSGNGISIFNSGTLNNIISGNYIGLDVSGTNPLPNNRGIVISSGAQGNVVGPNNMISSNNWEGVLVTDENTLNNTITHNSIYANNGRGIDLRGGNLDLPAPIITNLDLSAGTAVGTACPFCTIELFSDDENEGRLYESSTIADANGAWSFAKGAPLTAPHLTATATDTQGNTSEFSMVPFIRIYISYNLLDGQIPLNNSEVVATLVDSNGEIKGTGVDISNDQGWFSIGLKDDNGFDPNILPGDTVSVSMETGLVVSAEVASITGDVDVSTDTISGVITGALEGQQVSAEIWNLPYWPGEFKSTIQLDGSYSIHIENFDVREGHRVAVWYRNTQGNFIGIVSHWLNIETQIENTAVWGWTLPGAVVQVTITDEDGVKGTAVTNSNEDGAYWTEIYSDTQRVSLLPGNTITVSADGRSAVMEVATLTGVMDFWADTICGIAPPNSQVQVNVWDVFSSWYPVDETGHYCTKLDFDLQPGHQGEVIYLDENGQLTKTSMTYGERQVTPVTLGQPMEGSVKSLVYTDYMLEMSPGEPLLVEVTPTSGIGLIWLYGRLGDLPSQAQYDFQVVSPTPRGTYELLISPTRQGVYFFSVFGWDLTAPQGNFIIVARAVDRYLSDVQPRSAGNKGMITLNLRGLGFVEGVGVELRRAGSPTLVADSVMLSSVTEIAAHFDLVDSSPGLYDVAVIWPGGPQETIPATFEVFAGGVGAKLEASLDAPEYVRPDRSYVLWLDYANTGDADMPAPLFIITSPDGAPMRLAEEEAFEDQPVQILGINFTGLGGNLSPGATGHIPVYFHVPADTGGHEMVDFDLAILISDTLTIDWDKVEDEIRPPDVNLEIWDVLWPALTAQIGDTWGDYRQSLADNASYLSTLGRTVYNVRELFRFEVRKALGMNPRAALASRLDATNPAPGMPLNFGMVYPASLEGRFYLGPLGRGWSHSYDIFLEEQSSGDILLHWPGSFTRLFTSNEDGTYSSLPGDYSALTRVGAIFELSEKDSTIYHFLSDGRLDNVEDPNGNRITMTYDGSGRLIEIMHSNGDSFKLTYNPQGRLAQLTDHAGRVTEYVYDASGEHLLSCTQQGSDAGVRVTAYTYQSPNGTPTDHALLSITFPDDTHRYYNYDSLGRLSEEYLDSGAEWIGYTYDALDRIHITDAVGEIAIFSPDEYGRPTKMSDALGHVLNQEYNAEFNLDQITDPNGQPYAFEYDLWGNVIAVENPLGQQIELGYDTRFGEVTSLKDARGNQSTFNYDDASNLIDLSYPDGSKETLEYDSTGNLITFTNRSGDTIDYTYNPQGQLLRKDYPDGSWVTYTYDAAGNLTFATNASGTIALQYDPCTDWLTRIDYPSGLYFEFAYNSAGQRILRVDQDGHEQRYEYDDVGRLSRLSDENNTTLVSYTYDSNGRLEREIKGNSTYTTYTYDAVGQLLSLVNYAPDDIIQSRFDYTYDANGNRTSMTTLVGTTTYEYDLIGQLTGVNYPDGRRVTYAYDAAGNRTMVTDNGMETLYTTNNLNQYTQVGDAILSYDTNGNLTSKTDTAGTTIYEYNIENRLVRVNAPVGETWEYTYDAFGDRTTVTHNGVMTRYVFDPIGLVDVAAEYDGSGTLVARYVHGLGLAARIDPSGNPAYFAFDATGNTREMSNESGGITNTYDYDPFGILLQKNETIPNPFQYTGKFGVMADGNDINYMRARYYNRQLGKFLSGDLLKSLGTNTYAYVFNSPLLLIDPLGLEGTTIAWEGSLTHIIGDLVAVLAVLVTVLDLAWRRPKH